MFASGRMRRRYGRTIVLALVSYRTVAQENVVTHDSRAVREMILFSNVALSFFEIIFFPGVTGVAPYGGVSQSNKRKREQLLSRFCKYLVSLSPKQNFSKTSTEHKGGV